jgi:DNA repair exonuclease SbcCD nuclease subunit
MNARYAGPAMLSFLTRSDCHLADRAPVSRHNDYQANIFGKLDQIYRLAEKHQCTAILDAGDVFHLKAPTRNSHNMIQKIMDQHYQYKTPVYAVIGNHDIQYQNISYIANQPLGVLFASQTYTHITDNRFESDGIKCQVIGIDYSENPDFSKIVRNPDVDCCIAVFHGNVGEQPTFLGEPCITFNTLSSLPIDVWVLGHIHKDQGVRCLNGKWFVSPGAVSRGALTYDDLNRKPSVGLIQIERTSLGLIDITAKAIPLRVKPAEEVFDMARKKVIDKENSKIETFVSSLLAVMAQNPLDRVSNILDGLKADQVIKDTINEYIERAEETCNSA